MVAAPGLRVVGEQRPRDHADRAIPGHAVAVVVADDQVGGVALVGTGVQVLGVEGVVDADRGPVLVAQPLPGRDEFALEGARLVARLNDAGGLAALQVEEHAGQAERVRPRARPIHALQPLLAAVGILPEDEVAVVEQPAVQVHAAPERGEAVVRENDQQIVVAQLLHHPTDQGVVVPVVVFDRPAVPAGLPPRSGRVAVLHVAPEHVLDAVGGVEDAGQTPPPQALQSGEEHLLPLTVDVVRLLEEGRIVRHALVERGRVLRQTQSGEVADPFRQVGRVVRRMRDRHRRLLGVDVDGRQVERGVLTGFGQHHPGQAVDLDSGRGAELETHPVGERSPHKFDRLARHRHRRGPGLAVDPYRHRHAERRRRVALQEAVLGPLDQAVEVVGAGAVRGQRHAHTALPDRPRRRPRRVVEERTLAAHQVRHAHRRQLGAVEPVRREGDRNPEHRAPDVAFTEHGPERLRPPEHADLGLLQRDLPFPELQKALDSADVSRGQLGKVAPQVAVEEVEDVVLARIRPGREGRPGDRRQRRVGAGDPPVAPLLAQALEVGQFALLHHPFRQPGILAVETDEHEPLDVRLRRLLPPHDPPQRPHRPRQQRDEGEHDRRQQHEERRHQREPRPGAYVGRHRRRGKERREKRQRDGY